MFMHPISQFTGSALAVPERARPIHFERTTAAVVAPLPKALKSDSVPASKTIAFGKPVEQRSISEQLFVALAEVKIWTSKVAMHLGKDARDRLFKQLDVLHDAEEWTEDDRPVDLEAFKSFVRAILYHRINSRPALSLMPSGNLLALWRDGNDKLTVEFMPKNQTRWFVQNATVSGPERTTGTSPLERLRDVLQPYGAERWFDGS